jgi:hypothetical protein
MFMLYVNNKYLILLINNSCRVSMFRWEFSRAMGHHMNIKERDAFTRRCLLVLATALVDGDRKTVRVVLEALASAHRLPASCPPR